MQIKVVTNFVLYQIGWFACVLGAAKQLPWLGVAMMLIVLAWHLKQAKAPSRELALILIALIIGGTFDQLLLNHQIVDYEAHGWTESIVPVWMLALWVEFATVLNVSLRWMRRKWLVAVVFGAIGGPLAYMAADLLGALNLNPALVGGIPLSYLLLSVGWAMITPLLFKLSMQFDGFNQ